MNKILQLQGLRAFAMFGIFVMHTCVFWGGRIPSGFINQLGSIGVITFFMLSGFLLHYKGKNIPSLLWRERFCVCRNKFRKLYLLYILTLIVAFIGRFPKSSADWGYAILSFPLNLLYVHDLVPHTAINNSFNGPAWYISAMFIIWFIVYSFPQMFNNILRFDKVKCIKCVVILIFIQSVYKIGEYYFPIQLIPINHPDLYMTWISYFSPFYNIGYFLLGCLVGRLTVVVKKSSISQSVYSILVLVVSMMILFNDFYTEYSKGIIFEILIAIFMFSVMSEKSLFGRILSLRIFVWFGNVSGSFFLIHGAVNYNLRYIENDVQKPLLFFISLFISVGLSVLSDKYLMLDRNESILQAIRKIAQPIFKVVRR